MRVKDLPQAWARKDAADSALLSMTATVCAGRQWYGGRMVAGLPGYTIGNI